MFRLVETCYNKSCWNCNTVPKSFILSVNYSLKHINKNCRSEKNDKNTGAGKKGGLSENGHIRNGHI
jgi:hypothetical protein